MFNFVNKKKNVFIETINCFSIKKLNEVLNLTYKTTTLFVSLNISNSNHNTYSFSYNN